MSTEKDAPRSWTGHRVRAIASGNTARLAYLVENDMGDPHKLGRRWCQVSRIIHAGEPDEYFRDREWTHLKSVMPLIDGTEVAALTAPTFNEFIASCIADCIEGEPYEDTYFPGAADYDRFNRPSWET